ncbi:MAG: hypothetical protein KA795_10460 [Burkholderiaceae bacterium]|nr:hypothetical protein [Burkholderiaceae bacterium]
MSTPTALLSLWNGVDAQRIPEYDRWHTLEHVPERVWVPGFVSGTRYVGESPGQTRYFTLYELGSLDCLDSPAYQDLVSHPSPWSASMRLSMRDFLRKTGNVVASAGSVQGAVLAVVRMVWSDVSGAAPDWHAFAAGLLADGAPACMSRVRIQQVVAAGAQAMANQDDAPAGMEYLCLTESSDAAALDALVACVTRRLDALAPSRRPDWVRHSRYRFACRVDHSDVAAATRPAPRLDLMPSAALSPA